jgi:hypothetical protein
MPNVAAADDRSPFWPLLVWLLPQLAVLMLMAGQVPIVAPKAMPRPAELWAARMMITVQIVSAALLFPFLLRDVRAAALVGAAAIPMGLLAAFLAGTAPRRQMVAPILYLEMWLATLFLWRIALRTPRSQGAGIATALFVALGAIVYYYVRLEYGPSPEPLLLKSIEGWSPVFGAIAAGDYLSLTLSGWLLLVACLGSGLIAAGAASRLRPPAASHPAA